MALPVQTETPRLSAIHRSDIVFAAAILLLLWVAYLARDILLLIYVSALFAVVIMPAIEAVQRLRIGKWRPGRGLAIGIILTAIVVLLVLFLVLVLPPMFGELQAFAADLPHRAAGLLQRMRHLPFGDRLDPGALQSHAAAALGGALGILRGVAGGLIGFFSCVVLTIYFVLDGHHAFSWAMSLVPLSQRPRLEATMLRAELRMRNWLAGQFALMLLLGVSDAIAYGLLHIKYAYILAVLAGVLNIVPIIGPIIAVTLASIVAVFDSWTKAAGVVGFYLVYQQVETAFFTPRIMRSSVDLPALAVIIALALGGALEGIIGALIAVPTAALIAVLVDEYLVKKPALSE